MLGVIRPMCDKGHVGWTVQFAGPYAKSWGPHNRFRYRCVPPDWDAERKRAKREAIRTIEDPPAIEDDGVTFQALYPDDASCRAYLVERRWPDGFRCPAWRHDAAWRRSGDRFLCRRCRTETSVTAGTIVHGSRLTLLTRFLPSAG